MGDRAEPLFSPKSPRPQPWRPGRLARALLGAIPGLRQLALEDVRRGAPLVALGVALIVAFAIILSGWAARTQGLVRLRIDLRLELLEAVCLALIVFAYEGLRLVASLEERTRRPWGPRVAAAPLVPAAALVALGPAVVSHAPRLLESLWWAALVAGLGAVPPTVWCLVEDRLHIRTVRFRAAVVSGAAVALPFLALFAAPRWFPETAEVWADRAAQAGFAVLSRLLSP